MSTKTQQRRLDRAEELGEIQQDSIVNLSDVLGSARAARVDPRATVSIVKAIGILGGDPDRTADHPDQMFGRDVEMLDAAAEAQQEMARLAREATEIHNLTLQTALQADGDLEDATAELKRAQAMAVSEPCDGCHSDKEEAIAEAEAEIRDATSLIEVCDSTIEALGELHFTGAVEALETLPEDLYDTYETVYALIRIGAPPPTDGDFITGNGAVALAQRREELAAITGRRPDPTVPGSDVAHATGHSPSPQQPMQPNPRAKASYLVTVAAKDGQPINPKVRSWLGLPARESPTETVLAPSNAALHRELDRLRHPLLDVSYRLTGADGEPFGPVVRVVECDDRWLRHDLHGSAMFLYEKPSGKDRFQIFERGAGGRGMARQRAAVGTLPEAIGLAATLSASTPQEILADVETHNENDRREVADLIRYAQPGTRLWILPLYGDHGYRGTGQPATALGLGAIRVEAMFGSEPGCWVVRYRRDDGTEGTIGAQAAMTLEEAAARWWVVDGRGNLLSGGHPDKDRMIALAATLGGQAQLGLDRPATAAPSTPETESAGRPPRIRKPDTGTRLEHAAESTPSEVRAEDAGLPIAGSAPPVAHPAPETNPAATAPPARTADSAPAAGPGASGPAQPTRVVMTTADGESRETRPDRFGSYLCGFCSSCTASPEGWAEMQRLNSGHYARQGEPYEIDPYPESQRRTWEARGCFNPACLTNLDAAHLAAARRRIAEAKEDTARRQRQRQSLERDRAEREEHEGRLWSQLSAQAKDRAQCFDCLTVSDWRWGRPKLVRHRDPGNCPEARKRADR